MAWTVSLPAVVTGNPTKASDYNNLLNNVLFRRDTTSGDVSQMIIAVGSDGSAAAPAIKRNADATGIYFAAGAVSVSCAGTQMLNVSTSGTLAYASSSAIPVIQALIGGASPKGTGLGNVGVYVASLSATAAYGVYVDALTAASAIIACANQASISYGINFGTLTSSGASVTGINIGNLSGVNASYGINVGTVATSASGQNSYGVYLAGGSASGGGGALPYSLYSAGSGVVLHNAGAIRIAGGDPSAYALASTTMFTNVGGAVTTTNTYAIKGSGAAGLVQGTWLKVYVGTTPYWIPAWATI